MFDNNFCFPSNIFHKQKKKPVYRRLLVCDFWSTWNALVFEVPWFSFDVSPKIISLVVAVRLVWSHDPGSYTGRSFGVWQVLPSQPGQRVGSRQIDDRIAEGRARVVLTGWYGMVYPGCDLFVVLMTTLKLLVGVASITYQISNQKNIFRGHSTSEWVSDWVMV